MSRKKISNECIEIMETIEKEKLLSYDDIVVVIHAI